MFVFVIFTAENTYLTGKKILSVPYIQKAATTGFPKKSVLKNFAKFTGKHQRQSLFFNKVAGLRLRLYYKRDSGTDLFL